MKKFIYLILIICIGRVGGKAQQQQDNITEVFEQLSNVFYYNSVEVKASKKYNFKPGEIPKYAESVYIERLNALSKNSPFNYTYNSVVRKYIDRYTKNIRSISTILALSKLYFPLYEKYLVQNQIPVELKYLSIVESALNPTAKSGCGAAGLWQFMYGTGRNMQLTINSYIDERFDPEKETIAACRYLKELYDIYGDWSLSIAAYNCGPGNVNKGIKKAGKKDFWAIYDYLPKETQGYVPAFIAISYIMTYHEEHNMMAAEAKFLFDEMDQITLNQKTTIAQLAKKLRMDSKQLTYLNPKYYTGIIPGNDDLVNVPRQFALDWIDIEKGKRPEQFPTTNKTGNDLPAKEQVQKVSGNKTNKLFGTSIGSNSEIKLYASQYDNYNQSLKNSKASLLEITRGGTFKNLSTITLTNANDIFITDSKIPANSLFKAKIIIQNSSVAFHITQAVIPSGQVIKLNIVTDSGLTPKDGTIQVEKGFDVIINH